MSLAKKADVDRVAARFGLPEFAMGSTIPRIICQTYPTADLPADLQANVDRLKAENPGWEHRLFDDAAVDRFVRDHYGQPVLSRLQRIAPGYGAARADLFRYLLMYHTGGIYLDIKSGFDRPIDQALAPDERFLISQWNHAESRRATFGVHREIADVAGGEFQNWQISTVAGHPFLRAVIAHVMDNIDRYNPWRHGSGGRGVYRLTGPVAYTRAIAPLLSAYPHRIVQDHEVGLVYTMIQASHKRHFKGHYLMRTDPVVLPHGLGPRLLGWSYGLARRIKRRTMG